jgi:exopolysaccharide biosynthesis polyprenyl glycosylphosphotransferase
MKSDTMMDIWHACEQSRTKLKLLSQESEDLLRFAYVTDIAGIPLYSPPQTKIQYLRAVVKRAFDIAGSSILILLFSPVLLFAALAIYLESGRPVIFKQRRSSIKGGKEFFFYKFRSMVKNADELKDSLYERNESDGTLFKMKDDPRMTEVGRFIRRYSIDELPQLFNVLKGDMSLVGPRPLPVNDFRKHNGSAEFWLALQGRDRVKPGITGLWQICGRSNLGFREMILLDFYYIENQSLFFDLEILFATVPVVLFGRGAY